MAASSAAAMPRSAVTSEKPFKHAHVCLPEDEWPAAASPTAMNFRGAWAQWNP